MSVNTKKKLLKNMILIAIIIGLAVLPLIFLKNAKFAGSDDNGKKAITAIDPNYKPWFTSVWQPPSGEISSMLFALQAAIGSGILFYGLGYMKGRSKKEDKDKV
jgi:cobalt/nickel transport protein